MKFTATIKILILSLVTLALVASGVVALGVSLRAKGADLAADLQLFANERARAVEQETVALTLAQTAETRAALEALVLANDDETIAFLSLMDEIATSFNIDLVTEKLEVREDKGAFNTLLITFRFSGADQGVHAFLAAMENVPYHSRILQASIERNPDSGNAEAEATLAVTMQKQE